MGDVISLQSRQRLSDYQDTPKSDWVTEQLILAYSDGDDVLERVLDQEDQDWLRLCIAHDLTQISLIERGIIL